jgi:hypothetical protein
MAEFCHDLLDQSKPVLVRTRLSLGIRQGFLSSHWPSPCTPMDEQKRALYLPI